MSDAAVIQAVFPSHSAKRLACLMDVPLETARSWIYRHLSAARRRELAMALIAELDRQDIERMAVHQKLNEMAGESDAAMVRVLTRPASLAGRAPGQAAGGVAAAAAAAADGATGARAGAVGSGVNKGRLSDA